MGNINGIYILINFGSYEKGGNFLCVNHVTSVLMLGRVLDAKALVMAYELWW